MAYVPPEGWNQRLISHYWPPLLPERNEARVRLKTAFMNGTIRLESPVECYCNGREFSLIGSRDRFGLNFKAKLCRQCGLILTDPRLAEKDMPLYYDSYYHQISFGQLPRHGLFGSHQGQLVFERVWAHAPLIIKDNARVLEIGAGLGNVLKEFGDLAHEKGIDLDLMGTEYSQECLAIIRELGISAVEGGCQDVLAASNEPFDIIILSHVMEHVTDLNGFMAGIKSLSSPETLLYVEVPGVFTLHAKPEYDFDFRKYFIHAHSVHYNFATLKYHMSRFGWSCLAGNEIVYGLFQPNSEASQPSIINDLADQVLFYMVNMEMTFDSNNRMAERLRKAETQANKVNKLTEQNTVLIRQKDELEVKRQAELGQQKKELEAQRQADLNKQKDELEAKRLAELGQQKKELESQRQADLNKQKNELEAKRQAERIDDLVKQMSEQECMPLWKLLRNRMFKKHKLKKHIMEYALIMGSNMFDTNFYMNNYPDAAKSDMDPLLHFIKFGWKEKCNPNAQFDIASYLERYQDVRSSGMNPLVHYLKYGKTEGRAPFLPSVDVKNQKEDT